MTPTPTQTKQLTNKQPMPDDLKDTFGEHLADSARVVMILVKEGLLAVVVLLIGRGIAWIATVLSPGADWVSTTVSTISDLGAILLFLVLVVRDLWEYFKNR